jgi:hypothetical protein
MMTQDLSVEARRSKLPGFDRHDFSDVYVERQTSGGLSVIISGRAGNLAAP